MKPSNMWLSWYLKETPDEPKDERVGAWDLARALRNARRDLAASEQRVAELEADAERLDWIESYKRKQDRWEIKRMESPATIWIQSGCQRYPADGTEKLTIRDCIDKAIAAQRQEEGK